MVWANEALSLSFLLSTGRRSKKSREWKSLVLGARSAGGMDDSLVQHDSNIGCCSSPIARAAVVARARA